MVINDLECDVENLTHNDFPDEQEDTAAYLIAKANLAGLGKFDNKTKVFPCQIADFESLESLFLPLVAFAN